MKLVKHALLVLVSVAWVSASAASTVHVLVKVTGACTFIHQSQDPVPNEPMTLAVMDGRNKKHRHIPVLIYPADEEDSTPSRTAVSSGDSKYIELKADYLSVLGQSASQPQYDPSPPAHLCDLADPSLGIVPPFGVVTHLRDLAKSSSKATPDLQLTQIRALTPDFVAAVVDITYGSLTTEVRNGVVWDFKTRNPFGRSFHRQPIAQQVDWTFDIQGPTLTLLTTPIGDRPNPTPLLVLHAGASGQIELTIANVMSDDIKVLTHAILAADRPDSVDAHFSEMYYDFIKDWHGPRPRPLAYSICLGPPGSVSESTDECDLNDAVVLHPPSIFCPPPKTHVGTIGGLNCGPDQIP